VKVGESPLFFATGEMKNAALEQVNAIAERVAAREGLEIVEVQLLGGGKARVLRIFIDKPGGVSHADCENVSHQVGTILDVEDVIPGGSYTLEVSSPGVERKLSKPADFERFAGQKAKLVLREPVANSKRVEGTLAGFADGAVRIELEQGELLSVPLDQVEKANLKFEW
jgi:ribosome maturation factor RimP